MNHHNLVPDDLPPSRQAQLIAVLEAERDHRYRNTDPSRVQTIPQGTSGLLEGQVWRSGKITYRGERKRKSAG